MIAALLGFLLRLTASLPESRFGAWAAILTTPLVAWLFAAALVGPGRGGRFGRAAVPVGVASGAVLALVGIVRLVITVDGRVAGGPLVWLQTLAPNQSWQATHAWLGLALLDATALVILASVAAVVEPRLGKPFRVPLGRPLSWVLASAAVIGVALGDHPYGLGGDRPALDLAAALPLVTLGLAIWARADRGGALAVQPPAPAPSAPPLPAFDVASAWRSLGAIAQSQRPLASTTPVAPEASGVAWAEQAWSDAGGVGPSPRALEEVPARWASSPQVCLVGDLPDPSDRVFLAALGVVALRRLGLTCLIVAEEAADLHGAMSAAFAKTGRWAAGELVLGGARAREGLASARLPVAIFVTARELSSELLPTLGTGSGPTWAARLNLVLVAGVDRGSPLEVTHRAFALRRLGLALRTHRASCSIGVTGLGGESGRATVEAAFPGWVVHEASYGPRATAAVEVWKAAEGFVASAGAPWVRRALEPVLAARLPASVGDPLGTFESGAVQVWGADLRLVRDDSLGGVASASLYDEAWMLAAYRALGNRAPLADGRPHQALWGLPAGGVTRFLTRQGNLEGLARSGQLPSPRPLIGYQNRLLQAAHLRAALAEGAQDRDSLFGVFDRSVVESVAGVAPSGFVVRAVGGRDELVRTPLMPRANAADNPLRTTVTEQVVRVVNEQGGDLLAEVDEQVAATRYYPGRVFARGERRFVVPLQHLDLRRGELRVSPVGSDQPLTHADLAIRVEAPIQVQATQEVQEGRMLFRLATFEVTAAEEVRGYRQVGRPLVVKHAPVASRYRTRVRVLAFPPANSATLFHLARGLDEVLVSHLIAGDEDIEVFPCGELAPGLGSGVVVVDRYVQGMGAAEALDPLGASQTLKWVRAILQSCACAHGCAECTPPEVMEAGPDKAGVLKLLGA